MFVVVGSFVHFWFLVGGCWLLSLIICNTSLHWSFTDMCYKYLLCPCSLSFPLLIMKHYESVLWNVIGILTACTCVSASHHIGGVYTPMAESWEKEQDGVLNFAVHTLEPFLSMYYYTLQFNIYAWLNKQWFIIQFLLIFTKWINV